MSSMSYDTAFPQERPMFELTRKEKRRFRGILLVDDRAAGGVDSGFGITSSNAAPLIPLIDTHAGV